MELLLSDILGNELNKNVRFVGVFQVLVDWVLTSTEELVLFSIDVRSDKKCLVSDLLLHVDSLDSGLGLIVGFETNEACAVILGIHGARVNVSELLEDLAKLSILESLGQVSDEKVGVFALTLLFSLVLLGVNEDLNDFTSLIGTVELLNSFLSALLSLELNISLTSTVTACESFEFA